jgi:hypothetical protein
MAHRLKVSDRAVREIGEAYEWYEEQVPNLGYEFLAALENQFELIARFP